MDNNNNNSENTICSNRFCTNDCNNLSKYCDSCYDDNNGLKGVNFNKGMSRKMVDDIKGGSLKYPCFITDDDKSIIYGYEIVGIGGMASNKGNPNSLTMYKKYADGSHEKFEYKLEEITSDITSEKKVKSTIYKFFFSAFVTIIFLVIFFLLAMIFCVGTGLIKME